MISIDCMPALQQIWFKLNLTEIRLILENSAELSELGLYIIHILMLSNTTIWYQEKLCLRNIKEQIH